MNIVPEKYFGDFSCLFVFLFLHLYQLKKINPKIQIIMEKIMDHSNGNFCLVTRDFLDSIPLPQKTETYLPIKHSSVLNIIEERLDKDNLKILNESFRVNKNGEKMFGILGVESDAHPEIRMSLGLTNSYDKSMAVGIVAGAQVHVCTNGMFMGEFRKVRKHTANFFNDVYGIVDYVINGMQEKHYDLTKDVGRMKEFEINSVDERFLFGDILLSGQDIASRNVLSSAIGYWKEPPYSDFEDRNLWSFYNAFTEAYKKLSPQAGVSPYVQLHKYCLTQLN